MFDASTKQGQQLR